MSSASVSYDSVIPVDASLAPRLKELIDKKVKFDKKITTVALHCLEELVHWVLMTFYTKYHEEYLDTSERIHFIGKNSWLLDKTTEKVAAITEFSIREGKVDVGYKFLEIRSAGCGTKVVSDLHELSRSALNKNKRQELQLEVTTNEDQPEWITIQETVIDLTAPSSPPFKAKFAVNTAQQKSMYVNEKDHCMSDGYPISVFLRRPFLG